MPESMLQSPESRTVSLDQIQQLMRLLLSVPRPWLVSVIAVAVASLFKISRVADGAYAVEFHVTGTTTLLLALAWLPALLAVIALAGGGIKTPAGEATTAGLFQVLQVLDVATKKAILPPLVAGLEQAETVGPLDDRSHMRNLRETAEGELAALPVDVQDAREELERIAKDYDAIRANEQPGDARSLHMRELVVRARALASKARLTRTELADRCARFPQASPGERIVTLTLIETLHDRADCFSAILDAIHHTRSAFEQYRALRVAQRLIPLLNGQQCSQLLTVLDEQRSPGGHILPGSDRLPLAAQISAALNAKASSG